MKKACFLKIFYCYFSFIFFSPIAISYAQDVEVEYSYEDLVDTLQFQQKKENLALLNPQDPFETVQVHASVGLLYSTSFFKISETEKIQRFHSGLQLSLGMDLFNPSWFSEGIFKNYGLNEFQKDTLQVKELNLILGFKSTKKEHLGYQIFSGLANRFFKISTTHSPLRTEGSSAAFLIGVGLRYPLDPHLSLIMDLIGKTPLTGSQDQGSLDTSMRVMGHF